MENLPLFTGVYTSQVVVWDFFHQPYFICFQFTLQHLMLCSLYIASNNSKLDSFKSTFNKKQNISRYVHSNNNLRDVFGHSFLLHFSMILPTGPMGRYPRYLPNPHNSKEIPKHKLLVKHPGALWGGILKYWFESWSPPPSAEFVAGCFAIGA